MISFACKRIELEDLFRCSFSMNQTEYKVLESMLGKKPLTASQLAEKLSLERTTVQKALKHLLEKNLVTRIQENLDQGGYVFFYKAQEKKEIKARLRRISRKWFERVENEIDGW